MQYTQNAANTLHAPNTYIEAVMGTQPIPNPVSTSTSSTSSTSIASPSEAQP
jgi:hypothetical protein